MSTTTHDISDGATRMARQLQPCERRRTDRSAGPFSSDHFSCDLGEVIDVSPTGIRARVRWPVRPEYEVMLTQSTTRCMVTCRVRWARRTGLFTYEVGLEFANLTEQDLELLHRAMTDEFADELA